MELTLLIVKIGIAVFAGIFLGTLFQKGIKAQTLKKYNAIKDNSYKRVVLDTEKKFAYDAMEEKLVAKGIKYRMGKNFTPFDYVVLRLIVGFIVGLVPALYSPILFVVGFIVGFVAVPYYFSYEDKYDNGEMLADIGQMNSVVAMQLKSGVHISKVIYECCRMINNKRLKQAMMELSIDLENFATVEQAASQFSKKFSNPYIDNFAKILEQMQETGSSVAFFEDIVSSVANINEAIAIKQEGKAKRTSLMFQLLLFSAMFSFIIYILFTGFAGAESLW